MTDAQRAKRVEYMRKYRAEHPGYAHSSYLRQKASGYIRKYYLEHNDKAREASRNYYHSHRLERRAYLNWHYANVVKPRREGRPEAVWDRSLLPGLVEEYLKEHPEYAEE